MSYLAKVATVVTSPVLAWATVRRRPRDCRSRQTEYADRRVVVQNLVSAGTNADGNEASPFHGYYFRILTGDSGVDNTR